MASRKGMYSVIKGMKKLAEEIGVSFKTNQNVEKIIVNGNSAVGVVVNGEEKFCDILVSGADYHHTEGLLEKNLDLIMRVIGKEKPLLHRACYFLWDLTRK